ncbi:hypothetical protein MKX01_021647 [Papaver californicum]|nr:hypothetical protein MKX01_021647 [Papaver californicum]
MGMMSFSQVFRLLCMILLVSQVAWSQRGKDADKPRSPPPGPIKGKPSPCP